MYKINEKTGIKQNYTLVYYELLEQMKYEIRDYVVFDTLVRRSKKNEFSESKTYLKNYLNIAPNTINKSIKILFDNGFIVEVSKNCICINYEISELFLSPKSNNFHVRIFHLHRLKLGLSLKEYCLLYLFYSLSKKFGFASARVKFYFQKLNIKEREFHRIKNKFLQKGLILPHSKNNVKLSNEIKDWFDEQLQND